MPTYTPPSTEVRRTRLHKDRVGWTVLLESGTWSLVQNPTQSRMDAADRCYRGGYTYDLSVTEYNEIPTAYGGGTADIFVDMFEGEF